jgi:hypothetical protein
MMWQTTRTRVMPALTRDEIDVMKPFVVELTDGTTVLFHAKHKFVCKEFEIKTCGALVLTRYVTGFAAPMEPAYVVYAPGTWRLAHTLVTPGAYKTEPAGD